MRRRISFERRLRALYAALHPHTRRMVEGLQPTGGYRERTGQDHSMRMRESNAPSEVLVESLVTALHCTDLSPPLLSTAPPYLSPSPAFCCSHLHQAEACSTWQCSPISRPSNDVRAGGGGVGGARSSSFQRAMPTPPGQPSQSSCLSPYCSFITHSSLPPRITSLPSVNRIPIGRVSHYGSWDFHVSRPH